MPAEQSSIAAALQRVQQQIRAAEAHYARPRRSVTLLAVSKTKPSSDIRTALLAGQTDFGENYVDEAVAKIGELRDSAAIWHYIGQIQSNKTRLIAEHFDWVHSVDRAKIAHRLAEQRPATLAPLNICLQVKLDDEPGKGGVEPAALNELADWVATHATLKLRGLMVIPKPSEGLTAQRESFARARQLFETLRQRHPEVDTLSMGMSGDLEAAIAEGSTLVRVGTAIFGARTPHSVAK
jgi:hypothetical protein